MAKSCPCDASFASWARGPICWAIWATDIRLVVWASGSAGCAAKGGGTVLETNGDEATVGCAEGRQRNAGRTSLTNRSSVASALPIVSGMKSNTT
jgi:hypothetical protein